VVRTIAGQVPPARIWLRVISQAQLMCAPDGKRHKVMISVGLPYFRALWWRAVEVLLEGVR
jgi:hypothetical protein